MSIWQRYNNDEKLVVLQQTAAAKKIVEQAVEKDWWISNGCNNRSALQKYFRNDY
jgi:hypothetical protein